MINISFDIILICCIQNHELKNVIFIDTMYLTINIFYNYANKKFIKIIQAFNLHKKGNFLHYNKPLQATCTCNIAC